MSKIPVYLMPGLAASSTIFERIMLPENDYDVFFLEWEMPLLSENLVDYAKRMALKVTHQPAILIGVSFGGILVQEMANFLDIKKIIIISSVKNNTEFPLRMKLAKNTKAYKLIPTKLLGNVDALTKYSFGNTIRQRLVLYEKYLAMRDILYLDWAIKQVVCWERSVTDANVIHIHGDADDVFPIKNIKNAIVIKGGTHIMILNKFKWLNENLPLILKS